MPCESCVYYVYDEELDCYSCLVQLDVDEYGRFLREECRSCPYYRADDEYGVVRHQM